MVYGTGSLRINIAKPGVTALEDAAPPPDSDLEKLTKLFPVEVVSAYSIAFTTMKGHPTWWLALLGVAAIIVLRSIAIGASLGGLQKFCAVGVSVVSFLLWAVIAGDWFLPFEEPADARIIASAAATIWVLFAPKVFVPSK